MELFHGTRKRFKAFDLSFKGTGEAGKRERLMVFGLLTILQAREITRYFITEIMNQPWYTGVV